MRFKRFARGSHMTPSSIVYPILDILTAKYEVRVISWKFEDLKRKPFYYQWFKHDSDVFTQFLMILWLSSNHNMTKTNVIYFPVRKNIILLILLSFDLDTFLYGVKSKFYYYVSFPTTFIKSTSKLHKLYLFYINYN